MTNGPSTWIRNGVGALHVIVELGFVPERLKTHPASQSIVFVFENLQPGHDLLLSLDRRSASAAAAATVAAAAAGANSAPASI